VGGHLFYVPRCAMPCLASRLSMVRLYAFCRVLPTTLPVRTSVLFCCLFSMGDAVPAATALARCSSCIRASRRSAGWRRRTARVTVRGSLFHLHGFVHSSVLFSACLFTSGLRTGRFRRCRGALRSCRLPAVRSSSLKRGGVATSRHFWAFCCPFMRYRQKSVAVFGRTARDGRCVPGCLHHLHRLLRDRRDTFNVSLTRNCLGRFSAVRVLYRACGAIAPAFSPA